MRTCSLLLVVALLPRCCAALREARFRPGANNTTEWSGPEVRVVRQENGAVAWQIDGHQNVQPQFFKVALTHDPHAKDNWTDVDYELQLACKAAVPVVSFLINEANVSKYGNTEAGSSWSLFSRSFDASTEAMFARVERICPDAYLWPNIDAWLPPTSCGTPLDNVTLRVSTTGSDYVDYSNFNNAPNSAWLDCASSHLSSFMALLDGRFPGKIWGVQVSNLVTTEWFLPGSCSSGNACFELGDYSNSTRDAYCASIGQTHVGDGCEIPSPAERIDGIAGIAGAGLLATSNSARFAAFLATRTADAIATLARVTKAASNGKAFFATYYGYVFELSGCRLPATGHFAVSRLLAEPAVDGIISPYQYEDSVRFPGGALLPHGVLDSPSLRNKLYIVEDDSRTALCFKRATRNESIADAWCLGMRQDSFTATRSLLLRNLLTTSLHFAGSYWYDMVADGWFGRRTHPVQSMQLWDMHAAVRNRFQDHFKINNASSQPASFEIAVLVDDMSAAHITPPGGPSAFPLNSTDTQHGSLSYFMYAQPLHSLAQIGAPFRTFLLSDVLLPTFPAKQLKFVIITAAMCVTDEIAAAIDDKLKSQNRTILWLYAPGVVSAGTGALDPKGPARLTGLPLLLGPESIPLEAHEDATGDTLGGLSPGGSYNVTPWFGLLQPNNNSSSSSSSSTAVVNALANYSSHKSWAAIVSQRFASHTAIFSGVLNLPARVLQRFAADAGAHRWTNGTDDAVESAGNLLMLIGGHSGNAQSRRVQLPATAVTVYDDSTMALLTAVGRGPALKPPGRLVCTGCVSFVTDPLLVGDVRVYWIQWDTTPK